MSDVINLVKGQTIDLTKKNPAVRKYYIGMGWDAGANYDLDVSVFPCRYDGDGSPRLVSPPWFIFYNQLESPDKSGAIVHSKDNRDGTDSADGLDDEYILVDLDLIDSLVQDCREISFVVTIDGAPANGQKFGNVNNAYIRILPLLSYDKKYDFEGNPVASNIRFDETKEIRYDLTGTSPEMTAMQFGSLTKDSATANWSFESVGQGYVADLNAVIQQYMPGAKTKTA